MICPKCGKKLPDNAVKCNKCGEVFKEIKKNNETDEFLRKERLKATEKAKKLNQKKEKSAKNKKILKIVIPCVAVILIAAILTTVLIVDKNKKEQETIKREHPELLVEYTMPEVSKENALLTLGDINISTEEYEFFYRQSFSNIQNNALLNFKQFLGEKLGEAYNDNNDYYDEYYEEYAKTKHNIFDYKKPVSQQTEDALDENGNTISWQEYIRRDAINTLMGYRIKYEMAQKAGMTLTDDIRYQVYTHIEGLRSAISGSGYQNLNQYLQILFGSACNEEFFKNELIREYTASKYDVVNNIQKINSYSDNEIKSIYEKNRGDYDYIDLCVYEVSGSDAEKTANKIAKAVKDVGSFSEAIKKHHNQNSDKTDLPQVPKQYVDQTYSDKLGKWAYDAGRKAGDKSVFKTPNGYTVAVIQTPAYTTKDSLSYREIVINKSDENGNPLSEEKLTETRQLAQQIYDEWKEGNATEDTFAYYAITKSQGSNASNGGLVSFASANTLSTNISAWLTDSARKAGDTELFETDSSISIIYFMRNYGDYWNYAVRAAKAGESISEEYTEQKEAFAEKFADSTIATTEQQILKNIDLIYFGIQ